MCVRARVCVCVRVCECAPTPPVLRAHTLRVAHTHTHTHAYTHTREPVHTHSHTHTLKNERPRTPRPQVSVRTGEKWYQAAKFVDGKLVPSGWESVGVRQRTHAARVDADTGDVWVRLCLEGEVQSDKVRFGGEEEAPACVCTHTLPPAVSVPAAASVCASDTRVLVCIAHVTHMLTRARVHVHAYTYTPCTYVRTHAHTPTHDRSHCTRALSQYAHDDSCAIRAENAVGADGRVSGGGRNGGGGGGGGGVRPRRSGHVVAAARESGMLRMPGRPPAPR